MTDNPTQTTLVLIKPDGVRRRLVGLIVARIEANPWHVTRMRMLRAERTHLEAHYAQHVTKPFFDDIVDYMTSGPLVALTVTGPDAIAGFRALAGATRPPEAAPGTIRADLTDLAAYDPQRCENLVHGSDSEDAARREIGLWFGERL
jgi:nucleoside-diphosphate kinase